MKGLDYMSKAGRLPLETHATDSHLLLFKIRMLQPPHPKHCHAIF